VFYCRRNKIILLYSTEYELQSNPYFFFDMSKKKQMECRYQCLLPGREILLLLLVNYKHNKLVGSLGGTTGKHEVIYKVYFILV